MSSGDRAPHETDELWPFTVTVDGQAVMTGIETSLVLNGARPGDWTAAVVRDGHTHFRVVGLVRNTYRLWARVTRGDETPVLDLGLVSIG